MKKHLFLFILMLSPMLASAADVKINETTFPDSNFRNWVLSQEYGADGVLTDEELKNVTSLNVRHVGIYDLRGIEYFTSLKVLICVGNQLTTLDVSGCTELDTLACSGNQLTALNVSMNTKLISLECYSNQLSTLDLSKNTALRRIHCNNNQLTTLDVSKNTALTLLQCSTNLLTTLDLTKNSALKYLSCTDNKLTTLHVSNNKSLESITCFHNQLTSLDVSGCSALKTLSCSYNQLTTLDLSGCFALEELGCNDNQLTTLDLSENTALTTLFCYQNQIKGAGMDALVESLPSVSKGSLNIMYFVDEQNVMTDAQVAAAKAKGWTPYLWAYSISEEIETIQDDYRPFVEDGKVWKVGDTSGNPVRRVEYYYFDGDTIINGKTCKQMICQRYVSPDHPDYEIFKQFPSISYVGTWYEEDKKVYVYDAINEQFQIKYDFSLDANETLQIDEYNRYVIGPKQTGGLEGFKGVYRNVMWYGNEDPYYCTTWLEGVGGIDGPTINVYYGEENHALFLMSCTVGDEVIYLNDEYEDGATPDVAEARKQRIDFTHTTKIKPKTRTRGEEEQSLYGEYNDQKLGINLDPLDNTYQVCITDESGKAVYEKIINAGNIVALNIDISAYDKGHYTVTVENSRESFTGEFETLKTGISDAVRLNEKEKMMNDKHIYNLQGQRLNSLQKGLNIVNGRKIYVK